MDVIDEAALHRWQAELGHDDGWRFMTCRKENLHRSELAIVTLNPGDKKQPPPFWSMETEPSYFEEEQWENRTTKPEGLYPPGKHPLQIQIQLMCDTLGVKPTEVFSAQFVPFCSLEWSRLSNPSETVSRCRQLWAQTVGQMAATKVIAIGKEVVAKELATLLNARLDGEFSTGWGKVTMQRYSSPTHTVVALPHLSRFRIFGRPGRVAEQALLEAFGERRPGAARRS